MLADSRFIRGDVPFTETVDKQTDQQHKRADWQIQVDKAIIVRNAWAYMNATLGRRYNEHGNNLANILRNEE